MGIFKKKSKAKKAEAPKVTEKKVTYDPKAWAKVNPSVLKGKKS